MSDKFWLLGLLVITIGCLCGMFVAAAFGAAEKECTKLRTNEIIKLEVRDTYNLGGCDWLVGKILGNESGFKFAGHDEFPSPSVGSIETWILTK